MRTCPCAAQAALAVTAALCSFNVVGVVSSVSTVDDSSGSCFAGSLTAEVCCRLRAPPGCWDEVFTAERCCTSIASSGAPRSAQMVFDEDPGRCFGLGRVTYEMCCLPAPRPECFDGEFTETRCCAPRERLAFSHGDATPPVGAAFWAKTTETTTRINLGGRGNPECWTGALTFDVCCLPVPQPACFGGNKFFTIARCCNEPPALHLSPLDRLRTELFTDVDPYSLLTWIPYQAEDHYPDSHLTPEIVRNVVGMIGKPALWLEVGSFIGGSAVTTAATLKALNMSTGVICIDPFTGDVGMWATRKAMRALANHPYADSALKMDAYGHSRIYETFLANIRRKGHQDIVMPLRITSIPGMRLLKLLQQTNRIDVLPQVIYLDSAHEAGETLLEVQTAWDLLPAPGILLGDDWSWEAVRTDVTTFATKMQFPRLTPGELRRFNTPGEAATQPVQGVALAPELDGTWIILKRE